MTKCICWIAAVKLQKWIRKKQLYKNINYNIQSLKSAKYTIIRIKNISKEQNVFEIRNLFKVNWRIFI